MCKLDFQLLKVPNSASKCLYQLSPSWACSGRSAARDKSTLRAEQHHPLLHKYLQMHGHCFLTILSANVKTTKLSILLLPYLLCRSILPPVHILKDKAIGKKILGNGWQVTAIWERTWYESWDCNCNRSWKAMLGLQYWNDNTWKSCPECVARFIRESVEDIVTRMSHSCNHLFGL